MTLTLYLSTNLSLTAIMQTQKSGTSSSHLRPCGQIGRNSLPIYRKEGVHRAGRPYQAIRETSHHQSCLDSPFLPHINDAADWSRELRTFVVYLREQRICIAKSIMARSLGMELACGGANGRRNVLMVLAGSRQLAVRWMSDWLCETHENSMYV